MIGGRRRREKTLCSWDRGLHILKKMVRYLKKFGHPHLLKKERKEARLEGGKRNKGKLEERKMVIDISSFCLDVLII